MNDWTWEYVPDAAHVVDRGSGEQKAEVEGLAARIAAWSAWALVYRPSDKHS